MMTVASVDTWLVSGLVYLYDKQLIVYETSCDNLDPREIGHAQIIPALSSHLRPRLPRGVRREDVRAVTLDATYFVIAQTQHRHIRLANSALSYGRYEPP